MSRATAAQSHQGEGRGLMLARVAAVADEVTTEIAALRDIERAAHNAKHQHTQRITS